MRQFVTFKSVCSYEKVQAVILSVWSKAMKVFFNSVLLIVPFVLFLTACGGGGGSSDSGMLIEGTLIEAGGAGHSNGIILKHSTGQPIENVEVCALGECSLTDDLGQWGFVVSDEFNGGDVLFDINGHGIATETVVEIPSGASEVFLDFKHVEGGEVKADHITVDGETSHHEEEGH